MLIFVQPTFATEGDKDVLSVKSMRNGRFAKHLPTFTHRQRCVKMLEIAI
jgi:hypothetical protein